MADASTFGDIPPPPRRPVVVERRQVERPRGIERLRLAAVQSAEHVTLALALGGFFLPLLLAAFLTLDLPFYGLDGLAASPSVAPSRWLSIGSILLMLAVPGAVLVARRHGSGVFLQAYGFAWLIAASLVGLFLVYIAPQLEPGDMPPGRYVLGVVLTGYFSPVIAARIFDLTRGGRWFRAPFLSVLIGLLVGDALYFPIGLGGMDVPYGLWWAGDAVIAAMFALLFLPVYRALRRRIIPKPGLGGR